jgi:hypothetical protein
VNELALDIRDNFKNWVVPSGPAESRNQALTVEKKRENALMCLDSAKMFLEFDFDSEKISEIIAELTSMVLSYKKLRASFYCTLCDGNAQESLKKFWAIGNLETKNTMFFSKEFCMKFSRETIRGAYYNIFYLKNYLNYMKNLFDCKLNDKVKINFEEERESPVHFEIQDKETEKHIQQCFYNDNEDDRFENCKGYCSGYNLSGINKMYEGNLGILNLFVNYIKERINDVFDDPQNVLIHDVKGTLSYIAQDMEEASTSTEFFHPSFQTNLIDKMNTEILAIEGINPYKSGEHSNYVIKFKEFQSILASSAILALLALLNL